MSEALRFPGEFDRFGRRYRHLDRADIFESLERLADPGERGGRADLAARGQQARLEQAIERGVVLKVIITTCQPNRTDGFQTGLAGEVDATPWAGQDAFLGDVGPLEPAGGLFQDVPGEAFGDEIKQGVAMSWR